MYIVLRTRIFVFNGSPQSFWDSTLYPFGNENTFRNIILSGTLANFRHQMAVLLKSFHFSPHHHSHTLAAPQYKHFPQYTHTHIYTHSHALARARIPSLSRVVLIISAQTPPTDYNTRPNVHIPSAGPSTGFVSTRSYIRTPSLSFHRPPRRRSVRCIIVFNFYYFFFVPATPIG